MTDYSATIQMLTRHYLHFKEVVNNPRDHHSTVVERSRQYMEMREELLIDLSNKIIKELERNHGIL